MKSTLENKSVGNPKSKYPYLGIDSGYKQGRRVIVLFNAPNSGMVVHVGDSDYKIGKYETDWAETNFEIFKSYTGKVILENS